MFCNCTWLFFRFFFSFMVCFFLKYVFICVQRNCFCLLMKKTLILFKSMKTTEKEINFKVFCYFLSCFVFYYIVLRKRKMEKVHNIFMKCFTIQWIALIYFVSNNLTVSWDIAKIINVWMYHRKCNWILRCNYGWF